MIRTDARLSELFRETRSSVPGLTSMLKAEPDSYRPVFQEVYEQTLSGEKQALQTLPPALDLEQATLEFIEGGLVAGAFGAILNWARRGEVESIMEEAREKVAQGQGPQALAEHQARAQEILERADRDSLHQSFLEGCWVGALESNLHLGV